MPRKKKTEETISAFKGFNKDLACDPTGGSPFQYEIGKTFEVDGTVVRCASGGFHACADPRDVLNYYPLNGANRFCKVTLGGVIARDDTGDSKIAAGRLTVDVELTVPQFVAEIVKFAKGLVTAKNAVSTTAGNGAHSTTAGYGAHSTTAGDGAHSTTAGNRAHSTTAGDGAHSTTAGNRAHSTTAGDGAHSTTAGNRAIASALGSSSCAKAEQGGAITCTYWDESVFPAKLLHIRSSMVGQNGIKPGVAYCLDADGNFVEAQP